jgi:serine/threonine protein kinase
VKDWGGRIIKGYELHEQIDRGGYGLVYRAHQLLVDRDVAVKIILPQYANHPEFIRRFEFEAQTVARLEHLHIVPLYDYWREPDGAYLVMRWMRGGDVRTLLTSAPPSIETIARLVEQIGGALAVAHRRGVIHRDLKPANVLLDDSGNFFLADFGIAKDLDQSVSLDENNSTGLRGSPAYMAPEQIKAQPVTPQTDIYSLGIVLYELLTGELPFQASTPFEMMFKHVNDPVPPLQKRRAGLPDSLNAIVQRATAKAPDARYATVLDLVKDFQYAAGSGVAARQINDDTKATPLPSAAKADQSRATIVLGQDEAPIENPFKGLQSFQEIDAPNFFGRETLTKRLLERLAEPGNVSNFIAVVGPSGSGKSSAVHAGLIPALRRGALPGSDQWFIVEMQPGAQPLQELASALLRVAVSPPDQLLERLGSDVDSLRRLIPRLLPREPGATLVLVIDQFEELFTLVEDEATRAHILHSLIAAVTDPLSRLCVVVTMRADFYDRPLLYPGFSELMRQRTEVVVPLTSDELERAIIGPAVRAGLELEPGLVAAIVQDVGQQPGTLPLLQYALTELVEQRQRRTLTLAAYKASGGVLGALARRAEELYASLEEPGQLAARQLFLRLVALGRVQLTELAIAEPRTLAGGTGESYQPAMIDDLLQLYQRYRLLTFDRDPVTSEPTVEIAHQALIPTWPRLRVWVDISREHLRVQQRLTAAAIEWAANNNDPSFLAAGGPLAQFIALTEAGQIALNAVEQAYLAASLAERDRQEVAERDRQQREIEQARALAEEQRQRAEIQAAASQRLRRRAVFLAGALLVALVTGVAAAVLGIRAERSSRLTQARYLAAQGRNVFAERPLLGLRLVVEGLALIGPDEQLTRTALISEAVQLAEQGRLPQLMNDGQKITASPYSVEELVHLVCDRPFASSLWTSEDQQLLDVTLGEWDARACR